MIRRAVLALLMVLALIGAANCSIFRPAADPLRHLTYTDHDKPVVNPLHIPVWYDSNLSPELQIAMTDAVAEWNLALNGYRIYEFAAPEDGGSEQLQWRLAHTSFSLYVKAAFQTDLDYPGDGVLGWVDMEDGQENILHVLADSWNLHPEQMKTVIMHEIGHTLGLDHSRKIGLLYPIYTEQPTCIDFLTVQKLAASHEWDSRHMNYCQ